MGSLSDLFLKYGHLLESAFDIDDDGNLVEKDASKVLEADSLFHDAFVSDVHEILKELAYNSHAPQPVSTINPALWAQEYPSWLVPYSGSGRSASASPQPPMAGTARQPGELQPNRVVTKVRTSRPDLIHGNGSGPQATGTGPAFGTPRIGRPAFDPNAPDGGGAPPAAGAPASMAGNSFGQKAPGIMSNLMRDFGLKDYQAAAIVGNLGHETGGFQYHQELNPRGGRGGIGWAQWTGPRRVDYENYAKQNGLDPRSDTANYGFLKQEIQGKYGNALEGLKQTQNADQAMRHWEGAYESAGVKNYPSRLNYTNMALDHYNRSQNPQQQNPDQQQTASGYVHPVTGSVSGAYGDNRSSYVGHSGPVSSHIHAGTDFAAARGSAVGSVSGGTVLSSGWHKGYGNTVDVLHSDGSFTRYAHLANPSVKTGDQIAAGQQLGQIGPEGHVHFEAHTHYDYNNPQNNYGRATTVDPTKYLGMTSNSNMVAGQPINPNQQTAQQSPNQQSPNRPQPRLASLDPRQQLPGGQPPGGQQQVRPLAIGDSLAVGVGGIYGDTRYAAGGWNPQRVNDLVDKAVADGSIKGRPVVLSGGASNAGGNTQMVQQYYPQMIKKLQDAGASHVSVLGVGPYSHYDNYGYNDIINQSTQNAGVHFTGPLANIAKFSGTDVAGGVHPNDYRPIVDHINQQISAPKPPANVAQATPPQPTAPTAPPPQAPQQQAQAQPPKPLAGSPQDVQAAVSKTAAATPSPQPTPPPSQTQTPPQTTTPPEERVPQLSSVYREIRPSHVKLAETRTRTAIGLLRGI